MGELLLSGLLAESYRTTECFALLRALGRDPYRASSGTPHLLGSALRQTLQLWLALC